MPLQKQIITPATPDKVFDALTDPDAIIQFFPLTKVESEWRVGGEVQYFGNVEGKSFVDHGTIRTLERPARYSYAYWSTNHDVEHLSENHQTISYEMEQVASGTRLHVMHDNFQSERAYRLMNDVVRDHFLGSLKTYVEGRTAA